MDGVNPHTAAALFYRAHRADLQPPETPLAFVAQNLGHGYRDRRAPGWRFERAPVLWRLAVFAPAAVATGALGVALASWLSDGGMSGLEMGLVGLVCLTFFWISLSVSTATAGLLRTVRERAPTPAAPPEPGAGLSTALLVPIFNEVASDVMGNAAAMLASLRRTGTDHAFTLFILSDTQDPAIAADEEHALGALLADQPDDGVRVFYRRRPHNRDRKSGNIADWIERWGGGYQAMVVLDADSLMSGAALVALTDALASDPSVGLIQSFPRLIGARTLFARVQQFSGAVYGALLARGLATWTGREGNYWGHNAIIRTEAFAASAGLPRMPSLRGRGSLIMSHDFVEAALLRRAGWAVRFLPGIGESYEESPASLVDYALRDRRWCHGNLQHLALLGSAGFHPASRFHLFNGAMSYLLSPAWFVLLTVWTLLGKGEDANLIRYFSETNPLMPSWPDMSPLNNILFLLFMYGVLLAPKVMGALALPLSGVAVARFGGLRRFLLSFASEIGASVAFAPILMVQQLVAVLRTAIGISAVWAPQRRSGGNYPLLTLARFHALETLSGAVLIAGMLSGVVSLWLLPIAMSLAAAVPLSALSGIDLARRGWSRFHLGTPEVFDEPEIVASARVFRDLLRAGTESGGAGPEVEPSTAALAHGNGAGPIAAE